MEISLNSTYQRILEDLYAIIKEEGSRLTYYDPLKGVIVIKRPWWSWDAAVLRVIDVTQIPGGCLVKVHSFMDRNPVQWPRRMRGAELRIIDGLTERMPSKAVPS
jgi:hypothetical protein